MEIKKLDETQLRLLLDEACERFHIPSYSISIYKDGNYTHLASGCSDMDMAKKTDKDVLYAIGSCTKAMIAGTICTLIDQGFLTLDDKVKKYIPEFGLYDDYAAEHLTVRDMLCHRCGLPRHDLSWYFRMNTMEADELMDSLRYLKPSQPFRYKWQYNNYMFAIAGILIERITGKSWEKVMRQNIFEPLGMEHVAFSPDEAKSIGICAEPYIYDKQNNELTLIPHAQMKAMGPAGCLYMSSGDLVRWEAMLLEGGSLEGVEVISSELCQELVTPQMVQKNWIIEPLKKVVHSSAYCLGLMSENYRGQRFLHHGGHIDGFMSDQCFLPEKGFAASILTNTGSVNASMILRYILVEYLLDGDIDWSQEFDDFNREKEKEKKEAMAVLKENRPENAPCPVALNTVEGTYRNQGYGEIEVSCDKDSENLNIIYGTRTFSVTHYANQFFYIGMPEIMDSMALEASIEIDIKGFVKSFSIALEAECNEKICFERIEATEKVKLS